MKIQSVEWVTLSAARGSRRREWPIDRLRSCEGCDGVTPATSSRKLWLPTIGLEALFVRRRWL
jgi:hypothetical protein